MDLNELLQVLWRRKLIVLLTTALVIGLAFVSLELATPQYEASTTLVLDPGQQDDLNFFFTLNAIVPIYSNAATSRTTRERAEELTGGVLGKISVAASDETPIIEVRARDPDPGVAASSAQAVSEVLRQRVSSGEVGVEGIELQEIESAARPTAPVSPRRSLTIAVATLLGLGFGIGMALLRETLTSKVETSAELSEIAGVPVYGEIPVERRIDRLRSPDDLVHNNQFRILAEAMRDLRTNLQFSENGFRSVVVTSPQGRHGKTTISFGLAVTLARAGVKTLLIDGDLRRGRVAEMLRMERAPGLWDALNGMPIAKAIRRTSLDTLQVMPAGRPVDNPGEVLSVKFAPFMERLEKSYDVIVIDSTPLVPVNDARIMASTASSTLIVASAESTKRRQVRDAVERLALVSVRPTAVVLNRSKTPRGDYYYGPKT
jgi:succinoglycan biosynthesis transport protein ExoP